MALHPDGTIDCIVDGQKERRKYKINFASVRSINSDPSKAIYEPELKKNEEVYYAKGKITPRIITVKENG